MAIELRRWQIEALEVWQRNRRGTLSVVTGAGKTIFALVAMEEFFRSGYKVLIVVPTRALQDQWLEEVIETWGVSSSEVSLHGSGNSANNDAKIHIAIVNTARRIVPELCFEPQKWVIVADECHRYGSDENWKSIAGDWAASLGLSATPVREFDEGFETLIAPFLGEVIYEYDYLTALKDGVLSKFKIENFRVNLTQDEQDEYAQLSKRIASSLAQGADISDERLKQLLFRRASVVQNAKERLPASALVFKKHIGERTLIFHERIESAEALAEILRDFGVRPSIYHSKMSDAARLNSLHAFRRGMTDVMITCRALDEGFDVPNISFGLIASGTTSKRQRIQRLGRVLRASEGKTHATIATIYATEPERERLSLEASNFGEEVPISWFGVR